MKKRLEASGLAIDETIHEPPDHLSVELEYLYFLLEKGWSDKDRIFLSEAGSFAAENMIPWVTGFAEKLQQEKNCLFYPPIALILVSVLNAIAEFKEMKPSNQF